MSEHFKKNNSLNMLEAIIQTSYDGIFITDGQARVIEINNSYERITGLKREQVLGRMMVELVQTGLISQSATLEVLKRRQPITLNQTFNTGKSALVTGTPFFDEDGTIQMVVTNVRDITELQILKEQYNESRTENIQYKGLVEELKKQIATADFIVAEDDEMLELLLMAKRVAQVDTTVIIYGETGTGKELISKYIYNNSLRSDKPFVKVNCGAIPDSLIESELFGYAEGAFTGAVKGGQIGMFEAADHGTLFLDEIGELPLTTQVKLLRVLQDGSIEKVGSHKMIQVDVRIIAATNKNLEEMVRKGEFRADLFYRLNVVPLRILPLRNRRSSIIPTVEYFLNVFNEKYRMKKRLSQEVLRYLYDYQWPGNVRELRNLIERMVVTTYSDEIKSNDLPYQIIEAVDNHRYEPNKCMKLSEAIERVESEMIFQSFERHKNVRAAARELGISPSTFVRKRKRLLVK
ncbi:sigma-54 interaction domain-containing protein [Bacilliculturomica massiliensis]|uniref:sigma-54 interaction domain-containing protein n=1 Tax=Bacilliculturomica massiliensis TaxID=1917867 RepID=UPI00102FCED3|nr:sigma 54-interacting transcriptional regulator [Bacilliculturomica massiliensis]